MGGFRASEHTDAIAASWDRCKRRHKLLHDTGRPILRLQSSEIAPRLEQIVERTGGRQGIFQQLASVAGEIGQVTVRGTDHYFSSLRRFACTGVPVLDASGVVIGAINLVSVDRGNRADYLFGQQILAKTAHRIQRNLFEKEFRDAMLVTVSQSGRAHVLSDNALVAVDEAGMIVGATSTIASFLESGDAKTLKGQSFEAVFNADSSILMNVPSQVLSLPGVGGAALNFAVTLPDGSRAQQGGMPLATRQIKQRRLPPSLQQLATGSYRMAAACRQAQDALARTKILHLQGETGTGKSALVTALTKSEACDAPVCDLDCATLRDCENDKDHLRIALQQARVLCEPRKWPVTRLPLVPKRQRPSARYHSTAISASCGGCLK
ncbi:hypothetical protein [Neptunicoccus sediminis]|uniref:hypothetical protein n=1 Tax=Neptunicoccus sediminis TaxID=1892596 RepID=UPI000845F0A4|nr:hypothetical protein [Neptunicoccus sediminis]